MELARVADPEGEGVLRQHLPPLLPTLPDHRQGQERPGTGEGIESAPGSLSQPNILVFFKCAADWWAGDAPAAKLSKNREGTVEQNRS